MSEKIEVPIREKQPQVVIDALKDAYNGNVTSLVLKMRLAKHQKDVLRKELINYDRLILGDDPGLGKTAIAIQFLRMRMAALGEIPIIVCPANLIPNWIEELLEWGVSIPKENIFSYEGVPATFPSIVDGKPVKYCFVWDEVHRAKAGYLSDRGSKFMDLSQEMFVGGWLVMSGTLMNNGQAEELFPPLYSVGAPHASKLNEYKMMFCAKDAEYNARVLKTLNDPYLVRRKKSILNLPPKKTLFIPVIPTEDEEIEYDSTLNSLEIGFEARAMEKHRNGVDIAKAFAGKALCLLNYRIEVGEYLKLPYAAKMAREFAEDGRKTVIFVKRVESVVRLYEMLIAEGVKCVMRHGGMTKGAKNAAVGEFQDVHGDVKVFISTIASGCEGITLTKSHDLILVTRDWSPGTNCQAMDRIHRMTQESECSMYWLQFGIDSYEAPVKGGVVVKGIDCQLLRKIEMMQAVIDGRLPKKKAQGINKWDYNALLQDALDNDL
jgi:hypothetical protein